MRTQRGLTITELLVVIAVIAILAGLLLPALERSTSCTQTNACLSNLKQIGIGMAMYAADTGWSTLPQITNVTGTSVPDKRAAELGCLYDNGNGLVSDGKVFTCPAARLKPAKLKGNLDTDAETSYSFFDQHIPEMYENGDPNKGHLSINSNLIIVAGEPAEDAFGRSLNKGKRNHPRGQMCLYFDSHVKFQTTINPPDDADTGSIYAASGVPKHDTRIE